MPSPPHAVHWERAVQCIGSARCSALGARMRSCARGRCPCCCHPCPPQRRRHRPTGAALERGAVPRMLPAPNIPTMPSCGTSTSLHALAACVRSGVLRHPQLCRRASTRRFAASSYPWSRHTANAAQRMTQHVFPLMLHGLCVRSTTSCNCKHCCQSLLTATHWL